MDELERRYRVLQRRTILYGLLAIALAMLVSLAAVLLLHPSVAVAGIGGAVVGIAFQLISWRIAIWQYAHQP